MQQNTYTRENKPLSLVICFHAPIVKSVKVNIDVVTVSYAGKTQQITANNAMCERLANAETQEQMLEFTRRFGQLTTASTDGGIPNDPRFTIGAWRNLQSWVRSFWAWDGNVPDAPCTSLVIGKNDYMIHFTESGVMYQVKTLHRLLELYLSATPPSHLKRCLNTESCPSPFIMSDDSRIKQCGSEVCRQWVHKKASKEYRANGPKRVRTA